MIVLGIDPGTATTGFAILKNGENGQRPKVIDFGCIITESFYSPGERLKTIHEQMEKIIKEHKPDLISVESLYFFKNLKTALPVSQAKGVILLAAAKKNIPVLEFTPLQMKMAIAGYGRAEKRQVQEMIKQLLDLGSLDIKEKDRKKDDATDALGIALCALIRGFK